jgi:hypothetical protein
VLLGGGAVSTVAVPPLGGGGGGAELVRACPRMMQPDNNAIANVEINRERFRMPIS